MRRRIGLLIAGTLSLWLIAVYPAKQYTGQDAVLHVTVAAVLCLIPTVGTLAWVGWSVSQSAEQQLVSVLGGTGVRMGLVLLVGLALFRWAPGFQRMSFLIWLLVFYLATLALEIVLLVQAQGDLESAKRSEDKSFEKS